MAHLTVLCGGIRWGGAPGAPDVAGILENLEPYGPAETWAGSSSEARFALAVRQRLSTSEGLSRGGGDVVACVDGYLHRPGEVAGQLGATASASDADLVRLAYEVWGESCVDHLTGTFAIAIADVRRGGLFLATDHAGSRPLAYHVGDAVVMFASTALALTGFAGVGHELDMQRAEEVLVLGYASERTFVRGVSMLPPGSSAWIEPAGIRRRQWWMPATRIDDLGSLRRQGAALRAHLEDAVGSSLRRAARVGAMVSGGLDSTSVAAVAAHQLAPADVPTFTSVPPPTWSGTTRKGWIASEQFAVAALAGRIPNLRPTFVDVPYGRLFDGHEDLWELGAGPARNPLNLVWLYACYETAAAAGVDVLLTGSSGNLGFSADGPLWLAELARHGRFVRMVREARRFGEEFDVALRKVLRRDVVDHLLAPVHRWRARRRGTDPFAAWVRATAINPDRLEAIDLAEKLPDIGRPHPGGFTRDADRLFRGGAAQAEFTPAVTAKYGVELRDPTGDRRLVEHALTQPEWWRRHDGEWRAIARAAVRDLLPPEIVDRQTLGAQQPDWLDRMTTAKTEVAGEVEAMRAHTTSCELIDVDRLAGLVEDWPDRDRMTEPAVVEGYQLALSRAIVVSRYLRWFEERARRVASGGPAVVVGDLA